MCGIFGAVLRHAGEVDVESALRAIDHRGPDARGIWRRDQVTLGHTRLAILDLSPAGAQPMVTADGAAALVFNGEIYNHHELRQELERLGHSFRSRSDTEVILEGYRAWGDGIVERLDGMFAIGIWDHARSRLVLARDRAGKKPLFYAFADAGLRFASEIKAIVASGFAAAVDASSLPCMLAFGYVPAPRTMYVGVAELPPASILTLDLDGAPKVRSYWRAPFCERPLQIGEVDAIREVRRLTERAVTRRLEADVPLGAFLSGGIDSSVIVGLMAKATNARVKTFSIGFSGDAAYDETEHARLVAAAFETDHTEFRLEPVTPELIERLVDLHDGPFGDSSAIPTSIVAALTRRHVTVALSGDGGDELFCGYTRFLATEMVEAVPVSVRRGLQELSRHLPRDGRERSPLNRAHRLLDMVDAPLADRLYRLSPLFGGELDEILSASTRAGLSIDGPLGYVRSTVAQSLGCSTLARILHHNFETYLPYDLLVKADRSSMMHGLEVRAPFLDTQLIELAARLPDRLRRRGLSLKWILKRAFADLLPPSILQRRKMGFGVPLAAWFRGELRAYLCDNLAPSSPIYDYLDRRYVARLLESHLAGRADHGHRLWLLLTLSIWLRSLARPRGSVRTDRTGLAA